MNSGTLTACPNCQRSLNFSDPIYILPTDPLNDICICETCGLVYKPLFNANPIGSSSNQYHVASWSGHLEAHRARLDELVRSIADVDLDAGDALLDVGAGIGVLHDVLAASRRRLPRYVAVEPVHDIALHLKATHPDMLVLNADFDDVTLPAGAFKVVFLCGVDYLFRDIRSAFAKVAALLTDDGVAVVQRNVFLDQQGYVGAEITDLDTLFSPNPVMRNWFHSEQYIEFVDQFLTIRRRWTTEQLFQRPDGSEFGSFTLNLVCGGRPATAPAAAAPKSYYDASVRRLQALRGQGQSTSDNRT
jgi:hypothetical protein